MADYDVSVLSLTTPAASAPLAQCRPVVSVRNNGLHDAVASGYIRIYSAGLLIYESELYSDTIGPGETRPASAVDYWTPPAEGTYIVQGYLSTPLDQVEPNNNLHPTSVSIAGAAPPPEPPVALHASQHESDGIDEISIEDLPGRAADQQRPINHATFHQPGGIDPLDVTDMPGRLGEAQTPAKHADSHKTGSSDPLSVLALPDATDLELIARKGKANGYASLDGIALVPLNQLAAIYEPIPNAGDALTFGSGWSQANALPHAYKHENGGVDEISIEDLSGKAADVQKSETLNETGATLTLNWNDAETTLASFTVPAGWMNSTLGLSLNLAGRLTTQLSAGALLKLRLKQGGGILAQLEVAANLSYDLPAAVHAYVAAIDGANTKGFIEFVGDSAAVQPIGTHLKTCVVALGYSTAQTVYTITGQFINGAAQHKFIVDLRHSFNTGQQT